MKYRIIDLANSSESTIESKFDCCIVGGGAAGLFLATQLAAKGMKIAVIEAGPELGVTPKDIGFVPRFLADYYPGAIEGRAFGLGGSTSRWGGLLIPHSSFDLRGDRTGPYESTWKRIVDVASLHSEKVLRTLGYPYPVEFDAFAAAALGKRHQLLVQSGFGIQASIFLPFAKKNLIHLLNSKVSNAHAIQIHINAVAKEWEMCEPSESQPKLAALVATSTGGNRCRICADRFILAAGALESARILLELQSQHKNTITLSKQIGMFLGDHLSIAIAQVAKDCQKVANAVFAPRFQSAWMRSFRFLLVSPSQDVPRAFAHFVFDNQNPGFLLAKKFLGGVQARRFPRLSLAEVLSGVTGLAGLASHRYLRSRLYVPPATTARLQLDVEQNPTQENRVTLGNQQDRYGRPEAKIKWCIADLDLQRIRSIAANFIERWNAVGNGIPQLIPNVLSESSQKPHDAYHPVGVCRMGEDDESVTDLDLKVRGVGNLWCVTTGVFPTAGTANPTFSMLCLAQDLVDRIGSVTK